MDAPVRSLAPVGAELELDAVGTLDWIVSAMRLKRDVEINGPWNVEVNRPQCV